jgi:hypothetical protein
MIHYWDRYSIYKQELSQPTSTLAINRLKSEGYGLMAFPWCSEDKVIINGFNYEIAQNKSYRIMWNTGEKISEVVLTTEPSLAIEYSNIDF